MEEIKICPKCKSEMEKGILKDTGPYNAMSTLKWGKEKSWWTGVKDGKTVTAYRCPKCGYLESYAR